jgi:hypothetical protein
MRLPGIEKTVTALTEANASRPVDRVGLEMSAVFAAGPTAWRGWREKWRL